MKGLIGVGVGMEGISYGFFTILQVIDSARLGLICMYRFK